MGDNIKIYTLDKSGILIAGVNYIELKRPILITNSSGYALNVPVFNNTVLCDAAQGHNRKKWFLFEIKPRPIEKGACVFLSPNEYSSETIQPFKDKDTTNFPKIVSLDELGTEDYKKYEEEFNKTEFEPYKTTVSNINSTSETEIGKLEDEINRLKREEYKELQKLKEPQLEDFLKQKVFK